MDRIIADTDENGVRRTYAYDARGNLIQWTDGLGNQDLVHLVDLVDAPQLHLGEAVHGIVLKEAAVALPVDGFQKTDEDGYVTQYEYSPVNLVSKASYADGKEATYLSSSIS